MKSSMPISMSKKIALGRHNAGTQAHLYDIPYDADRDWQSGQYHAVLDTTQFPNGRFLLTVDVFNANGELLHQTGTTAPAAGSGQAAPFTFGAGPMKPGRWWKFILPRLPTCCGGTIVKPRRKSSIYVKTVCRMPRNGQFLAGTATSLFSVGYRAYHEQPLFVLDHSLWWRRGLGMVTGNPDNVGVPPALPHESAKATFGGMLLNTYTGSTYNKCVFSVNLDCYVKTFDGTGRLNQLDVWDQAAFALDIGGPCIPLAELNPEALKAIDTILDSGQVSLKK